MGNKTLMVPKNPQNPQNPQIPSIPSLNLPCKMANGVDDRPFACEFRFDKLEILGKDGILLATVTKQNVSVSVPSAKAKKTALVNGLMMVFYPAKAYFTWINPPAFPVQSGYLIERSTGANGTAASFVNTLLTGIPISAVVGTKKTVAFDLAWPYNANGGALYQVHLENDVTTNMQLPKPGTELEMHDKAEASMLVSAKLVPPL